MRVDEGPIVSRILTIGDGCPVYEQGEGQIVSRVLAIGDGHLIYKHGRGTDCEQGSYNRR